jgi:hypothetical protein
MNATLVLLSIAVLAGTPVAPATRPVVATPPAFDWKAQLENKTVLVIGDSMIVTGLEVWMKPWIKRNGGRYERLAWASSTTIAWATTKRLDWALSRWKPDLVLVVLGSNELFLDKPDAMAPHIRTILKKIGTRPFRWFGPPIWRKDSGIVRVISENLPPGTFYPFNGKKIARDADGRHPNVRGSKVWFQDMIQWFEDRLRVEQTLKR